MCCRSGAVVALVALAACGGGGDGGRVSVTITPEAGGTLTSADGRFTLEVPPGAVSTPTEISVAPAPADDLPDAVAGLVYELQPDGQEFAVPATGTIRIPIDAAGLDPDELPIFALRSRSTRFGEEALSAPGATPDNPAPTTVIDAESPDVVVSGALSHFSNLGVTRQSFFVAGNIPDIVQAHVGDAWTTSLVMTSASTEPLVAWWTGVACNSVRVDPFGRAYQDSSRCPAWSDSRQLPSGATVELTPASRFHCDEVGEGIYVQGAGVWGGIGDGVFGVGIADRSVTCVALPVDELPQCDLNRPTTYMMPSIADQLLDDPQGLCRAIALVALAPLVVHSSNAVPAKPPAEDHTTVDARLAANTGALPAATGGELRAIADELDAIADELDAVFPCGAGPNGLTLCAPSQPPAPPGEYLVVASMTLGEIPTADPANRYQYGFVFDADGDSANNFRASASYPNDFFDGTDRWYVAGYVPGTGWTLQVTNATGGNPVDVTATTAARIVIVDSALVLIVPVGEMAVPDPRYRVTAFRHTGDFGLDPPYNWDGYVEPPVADGLAAFAP